MFSYGSLALLAISAVNAAPTSSQVERSPNVKVSENVLTLKPVGVKPKSSRGKHVHPSAFNNVLIDST